MKPPNLWLVKTEPEDYSYSDLERQTETVWDGVRNPLSLKHLRLMRTGDQVFIYHTGERKAVVGIAEAISDPYPDPRSKNPRNTVIKLQARRELPFPVPLAALKKVQEFKKSDLVRLPRLSVMPVGPEQKEILMRLAEGRGTNP